MIIKTIVGDDNDPIVTMYPSANGKRVNLRVDGYDGENGQSCALDAAQLDTLIAALTEARRAIS